MRGVGGIDEYEIDFAAQFRREAPRVDFENVFALWMHVIAEGLPSQLPCNVQCRPTSSERIDHQIIWLRVSLQIDSR